MTSDLSLINAALTRTGNDPISSLDEGSIGAIIATQNYEIVLKNELALARWKLPTKVEQLSLLDEDEVGAPIEPWLYAYALPDDLIKIRTILVDGRPIAYERMGQMIFCDQPNTVEVYLKYLWRPPESWFPPEFAESVVKRLEAIFLRAIKEDYREAKSRDDEAEVQIARARASDTQEQTPQDPVGSPTLRARAGYVTSNTLRARRA